MSSWTKGKLPSVEYRIDKNRPKVGVNFDRYYRVRFKALGKTHVIVLGHWSAGWTEQEAYNKAEKYKANIKAGQRPQSWKEEQEMQRAEAEAKERRKEEEERKAVTFGKFWDEHYIDHAEANKSLGSVRTEKGYYKNWIKPELGDKKLLSISPLDLERIKKKMLDAGRAPRSVQYCMAIIRQVFKYANIVGLFQGEIPTAKVKNPKFDNKRLRFLSHDEADQLLKALAEKSQQLHDMALLSLHCGLRAGEIFKLTWDCVDFERETLTLKDTKSGRTRTAYLTPDTKAMLETREEDSLSKLVFVDRRHKEQVKEVSNAFFTVVDSLGLNDDIEDPRDRVCFHTLRHTFASWLVQEGTDLYTVKELMGHSTLAMTERYSHLGANTMRTAVNGLARSIENHKKSQKQGKVINLQQG
jgi:integrase